MDEAAVGVFGLGGELLVEPVLLLCDPDADPFPLLAFGADHQLELADLLPGERGAGEGVVLAARKLAVAAVALPDAVEASVFCYSPGRAGASRARSS